MKIFDQPQNFPPALFHVWEYLRVYGGATKDDIVKWVAYPSEVNVIEDPDTSEGGSAKIKVPEATVRSIVKVGLFLNVFCESADLIDLPASFSRDLSYETFWHEVRECVLKYAIAGNEDQQSESLPVAIAWYLSFPVAEIPHDWDSAAVKLSQDYNTEENVKANNAWIISNDTQWAQFARWLTVLGFARELPDRRGQGSVLVPDISRSMIPTADRILTERLMPIQEFVSHLIEDNPCLVDGSAWNLLPDVAKRRSGRYSDVLLVGLKTLKRRNVIALEEIKDSADATPFGTANESLDRVRKA